MAPEPTSERSPTTPATETSACFQARDTTDMNCSKSHKNISLRFIFSITKA